MKTEQLPVDFPAVQAAIYGVALSLDAFLVNGILYGVLQQSLFPGFLRKTADDLMQELAALQDEARQSPGADQPGVAEVLAALQARCQEVVDLVTGLRSFKSLSPEQLAATLSRIPRLREACMQLIEDLERRLQTPHPFHQSRPADAKAAVDDFLMNLERVFAAESGR
jgi:hypothetical protein